MGLFHEKQGRTLSKSREYCRDNGTVILCSNNAKGLAIHELNQKFNRTFPQEFQGLFRIGQINGDTIFIEVANAIVRQGMLFRQLDLLTLIQKDYPQIKKLDLKISPEFNRAMP
ncbi:Protein of uncharacterised function (DUF721) [Rodentibacter pneumotropicus]|uniref:Protein of uncharacterized function (DUF721) n=1 Tax=Rodentibacter pneumotropicus TaxID=758 RepID=A0A448MKH5_9PAST|nr:Protein of uncharacterised function (DUF721) [Rodentibacter pneumotropicus]